MRNKDKKIVLVVPSLHAGGMEKIMSDIANFLITKDNLKVYLILLIKSKKFYNIHNKVVVLEPSFETKSNFIGKIAILRYLRTSLKQIKPYSILSFGSMYNSFVAIANIGLRNNFYLSDRSNPYRNSFKSLFSKNNYINDGFVHYLLKKILYRFSTGIIVQTNLSKEIETKQLGHPNIIVIPNPVPNQLITEKRKEHRKIILNVGRFIKTKQQIKLVEIFAEIRTEEWKLIFLGDGSELVNVRERVKELNLINYVEFKGNVTNVSDYYNKAEIFAFTSNSEGFPNALAEAVITPIASISFNCVAGPSDLIKNGFNGCLIPINNFELYTVKLKELMLDGKLREKYRNNSIIVMKRFNFEVIMNKFYKTLVA